MKEYIYEGRVWVITGENKELIPDIDTDQIFHNAYLHITDIEKMGQYTFDNLGGWKDFAAKAQPGDIMIAGSNFGSGSSRQQAVDCFKALGVKVIIAVSFGAIYKRNAINSGFPILLFEEAEQVVSGGKIESGDKVRIDLTAGQLTNLESGEKFMLTPFSKVQKDIYESDSLLGLSSE
ncbi:MAG: 3-isopropylmalate dehydratase [Candidatus Aminicenantes bacterium]|nr:3-isopropylmalate dehydratase [Candidatus Aminicenantes bacterium]